jgi:acyl carrier protein
MDDTTARLRRCFAAVFPDVGDGELETVSTSSLKEWDSIAGVTLVTVVEEEFGVQLPIDRIAEFDSYQRFRSFLSSGQ